MSGAGGVLGSPSFHGGLSQDRGLICVGVNVR